MHSLLVPLEMMLPSVIKSREIYNQVRERTFLTGLGQAQPDASSGFIHMIILFGIMFLLLYFIMIRPQKKKEQERLRMLDNLKKNDRVLTSGGIYGIITGIKDNEVTLKIDEDNNVKIRLSRSAIIGVEKSAEHGTTDTHG